jgi:hypothetical protein
VSDTPSGCFARFGVNQKRLPETAKPKAPEWPYTRFDWAAAGHRNPLAKVRRL